MKSRIKKYIHRILKSLNSDKNLYLVYTMGKVGSTSIYESFKRNKPYVEVHHTHFLSDHWLDEVLPTMNKAFHYNIDHGKKLRAILDHAGKRKIKVITLYREPVMRELSNLFQNWKHLYDDIEQESYAELSSRIEKADYQYALNWFDSEFKNYMDVDLYSLPFNPEKGFEIYTFGKVDILCIKLEQLDEVWDIALKQFTGYNFSLKTENISSRKKGSDQYSYLKKNIKLKKLKLDAIYQSKYIKHFYSQNEIDSFYSKWSK